MAGRNNTPKNDGPAAAPSRLDQFGERLEQPDKTRRNDCAQEGK